MSSLLRPVGPHQPSVYWFRRVLVLVVVVALVGVVLWWIGGRGSSTASAGTPSSSPQPSVSTTVTPTASASHAPSPTPTPTATPTPTPTASALPVCKDSQITVTASTDAASYVVGATPHLRMKIQNTSSSSCRRDVGAAQNELVIMSGSTRIWSSDDCNQGGSPEVVTLKPQQSYSVSVTWLGRLSKKGCPTDQPLAGAGSYQLTGRNGHVTSKPAAFALTAAA